jgi:hypothetical protein
MMMAVVIIAAAVRAAWGVKATMWRASGGVRIVLEMAAVVMTPSLVETTVCMVIGVAAVAVVAAVAAAAETEQAMAVVAELEQVMAVVGSGLMLLLIVEVLGIGEEEHCMPSKLQSVVQGMATMGWPFENIMGMMMAQQSGDREAREIEHRLCCKEMAVQREESHLAMEREVSLCRKEMALQRKENRVQRQMTSGMLMSLMQNNIAMSRMIASIGGIGAHIGVPPEQENVNAYTGAPFQSRSISKWRCSK